MTKDILDNMDFSDDDAIPWEQTEHEVVAKYYSQLEADLAAARLRSEGIPCFLANAISAGIMPPNSVVIRLHVRQEDLDTARVLLLDNMPVAETSGSARSIVPGLMLAIFFFIALILIRMAFILFTGQ